MGNKSLVKGRNYIKIAGALHNIYGKRLKSDLGKEEIIINAMKNFSSVNNLKTICDEKKLYQKRAQFKPINDIDLNDFPILTIDELKTFCLGSFQVSKSISYLAELYDNSKHKIFVSTIEHCLIKAKISSRHKSQAEYIIFIKYDPALDGCSSIEGWVCQCPNGLRTLRACIHVTAIIVYLACLRYKSRNLNPAKKLTYLFKDGQPVLNSDSDDE